MLLHIWHWHWHPQVGISFTLYNKTSVNHFKMTNKPEDLYVFEDKYTIYIHIHVILNTYLVVNAE